MKLPFLCSCLTHSEKETIQLGEWFSGKLKSGDVVCLEGNLGAGKTTFVKGIAKGLGWKGHVKSPGFVLVIPYETVPPLIHADLYRLKTKDVHGLGLQDYFDGEHVVIIEWADRMDKKSFDDYLLIVFDVREKFREIKFYSAGDRFKQFKL